jgi:membrane fusion protein, multidrug efflux system
MVQITFTIIREKKYMSSGEELRTELLADNKPPHSDRRLPPTVWIATGVAAIALVAASLKYSAHADAKLARTTPASLPRVVVSRPLVENLDTRLSFLGQFSAVSQVEVRAQVGGTLTGISFKDGDIVQQGDLLFTIDPQPYEIALAQATAQLGVATAHLELAERQLARAKDLQESDAGTVENVDQRTGDQRAGQASVEEAKERIRNAQFDLDRCRIYSPFTGRIGKHLVSIGNLISGSRTANGPTTLLATLVSLDPIYFDFDMSEADFLLFSKYRAGTKGSDIRQVALAVGDDKGYGQKGTFDFLDNVLDRSSGTIHARATVPNSNFALVPGEFARVQLVVAPPSPTLLVPDAVVQPDQSKHAVLTVSADGSVVTKQVELGDLQSGLRVIRSGLAANDRVIIGGLLYAGRGAKVTTQDGTITPAGGPDRKK